jgi:hypothetical protein
MARVTATSWFQRLNDGRVEIFLKLGEHLKLRAHGTEAQMNELLDWFEKETNLTVNVSWRERKITPIPGQMHLLDLTETQLGPIGEEPSQ